MPNHVHGIIELKAAGVAGAGAGVAGAENFLPFLPQLSQPIQPAPPKNEFQKMIPRSMGSIVKGFKIGVTKWFRENTDIHTVWQRNYPEHIIRNERSYHNISRYILNNPTSWKEDKFHGTEWPWVKILMR